MSVTVLSVQRLNATQIRLTMSEMAQAVDYNVKASNIVSASGYPLNVADDNANFVGIGIAPQLLSATIVDSLHLDIVFNEAMNTGSVLLHTDNYVLSGTSSYAISSVTLDGDGKTLHITFAHKILNGAHTFRVANLTDAAGNLMVPNPVLNSFSYTYTFPSKDNIIVSDRDYTDGSLITLYLQGLPSDGVYPTAQLKIDDVVVATWTDVKKYYEMYFDVYQELIVDYIHPGQVTIDQIKVEFANASTDPPDVAGLHGWTQDAGSTATITCEDYYLMYYVKILLTETKSNPSKYNSLKQALGTVTTGLALTARAKFRAPVGMQGRMELWVFPAGAGELLSAEDFDGTNDWVDVELTPVTPMGIQLEPELRLITNTDVAGAYTEWAEPKVWQEKILNPDFSPSITPWTGVLNSRITTTLESEPAGTFARSTITKESSPTALVYHAMDYDLSRNKTVMFGGWDVATFYNDIWEWDNVSATWEEITVTGTPPAVRGRHMMVYDESRNVFILFGGYDGTTWYNDTWEYDGATATWTQILPIGGIAPSARYSSAVSFDSTRNVLVLFGGMTPASYNAETWEYNGATATWTQIFPVAGIAPSARYYSAMVYDENRSQCLLFGGQHATARLGDTWEYNPSTATWTLISPTDNVHPTGRSEHSMVFDSVRHKCILFAGQDGIIGVSNIVVDTWEYTGSTATWVMVNDGSDPGVTNPSGRVAFAMAYNPDAGAVLEFSGYTGGTPSISSETWNYNCTTYLWSLFIINADPNAYGPDHWNALVQYFPNDGYNQTYLVRGKYRADAGVICRMDLYASPWSGTIPTSYMSFPGTNDWEDFELFYMETNDTHDDVEIRLVIYYPDVNGYSADWKNISVAKQLIENFRFRPRTLELASIILDGVSYLPLSPDVYSTGTWLPGDGTSVVPGYKESNILTSNGHFDFSTVDEDTITAGIDARIDMYRKGNGTVHVVNALGQPINGADVSVTQTKHGFLFMSQAQFFVWWRVSNPEMIPLIDTYEAEWEKLFTGCVQPFFWNTYEGTEGVFWDTFLNANVAWAEARNSMSRGVALLYNISPICPDWVNTKSASGVKAALLNYITRAVSTYAGRIQQWEVVDESTVWNSPGHYYGAPGLTRLFRDEGHSNLIWDAFDAARVADPTAHLTINDFHVTNRYFELLKRLERNGVLPFDGIEVQSHMHEQNWSTQKLWSTLNKLGSISPIVHLSETSIMSGVAYTTGGQLYETKTSNTITGWPTTAAGEARQAIEVEKYYKLGFSNPYVSSINWWNLSDLYAWMWPPVPNNFVARGLLRQDMTRKPAFDVVYDLIKNQWWTITSGVTTGLGDYTFRGFAGTYDVTVSKAGYTTTTQSVTLTTAGSSWTITLT